MAYVPITQEQFAYKRFKRNHTYHFASEDMIAPLALHELAKAMLHLPLGFAVLQEALTPVAILGLTRGKNLLVTPDGRWLGKYIPMCYRTQPFALANLKDDRQVLCCDDASDLLSDSDGEPFFDEQQNPSPAVSSILEVLGRHVKNRQMTQKLCVVLQEHGLVEQWDIKIKDNASDKEAMLAGLYRVNEVAFHQLPPDALAAIREAGVLPLIYCQLLSMQHLPILGQLSKAHSLAKERADSRGDLDEADLTFTTDDTTISFDHLD